MHSDLHNIAEALENGEQLSQTELALAAAVLRRTPTIPVSEALRERNQLIREYAERHCRSATSKWAMAVKLRQDARTYEATGWRRHRANDECPERILGTHQEILWQAFKSAPRFPWSIRAIFEILK